MRRLFPFITYLLFVSNAAFASFGESPLVQPKWYFSSSGVYSLYVNPSQPNGDGEATYQLHKKNDKLLWSGIRPYTLDAASVTDSGIIVGYAITTSQEMEPEKRARYFSIFILDPSGNLLHEDKLPLEDSRLLHGGADPKYQGAVLLDEFDKVIVRLWTSQKELNNEQGGEFWRIYELSTGRFLQEIPLETKSSDKTDRFYPKSVNRVTSLPLVLVHWRVFDNLPPSPGELAKGCKCGGFCYGSRFELFDLSKQSVWHLDLHCDLTIKEKTGPKAALEEYLSGNSAVLSAKSEKSFRIVSLSKQEESTFEVSNSPKDQTWSVRKVASRPFDAPPEERPYQIQTPPLLSSENLGVFELKGIPPRSSFSIRDIQAFDVDEAGRIGFIRREARGKHSFVLAASDGTVLFEQTISDFVRKDTNDTIQCVSIGENRWVVSHARYLQDSLAWRVNVSQGTITKLPSYTGDGRDTYSVEKLCGSSGGMFAANYRVYTTKGWVTTGPMVLFDSNGKVLWEKEENVNDPEGVFAFEDCAITRAGNIVVLLHFPAALRVFSAAGKLLKNINLETILADAFKYPTHVSSDSKNGVFVTGNHPEAETVGVWYHFDLDGQVIEKVIPRYSENRFMDETGYGPVIFKPLPTGDYLLMGNGRLSKLSHNGVYQSGFGDTTRASTLTRVGGLAVDNAGRIFASDFWTKAIYLFSSNGELIRTIIPELLEKEKRPAYSNLIPVKDDLFYYNPIAYEMTYLLFNGAGKQKTRVDLIASDLQAVPNSPNFAASAFRGGVTFFSRRGERQFKIDRQPNQYWLEGGSLASFAPDGSFVILGKQTKDYKLVAQTLNFYSPARGPLRTITLANEFNSHFMHYTGKYVILRKGPELWIFDNDGMCVGRVYLDLLDGYQEDELYPFLTRDAGELWFIDTFNAKVHRFKAVPEVIKKQPSH